MLPNLTAYNETCAAIGDVYWNHRLHSLTGDAKYFDVVERTLYNGLISGLSLDGTNFFYPNALESDGKYEFNQGACTRKSWFDCSCCPTNVVRFIPAIPGLIYSKSKNEVYVNLYASNQADIELNGQDVKVSQETSYPWNGKVNMTVDANSEITIKFRIPGWSRNEVLPSNLYSYTYLSKEKPTLTINGETIKNSIKDGYFEVKRNWNGDDKIELSFPMEVRTVKANDMVEEDKGKLSLEYGPLVYAVEEIDNPKFDDITISSFDKYSIQKEQILDGVNTLVSDKFKAIPYYAWSNRGVGKMKVWIPEKE